MLLFLTIGPLLVVIVVLGVWFHSQAAGQQALAKLLAEGERREGVLAAVGPVAMVGSDSHRLAFYGCEVTLELGSGEITTTVRFAQTALALVQAGARCEAIVDPAQPDRLCVVSLSNAFGVATPVSLASSHFPW